MLGYVFMLAVPRPGALSCIFTGFCVGLVVLDSICIGLDNITGSVAVSGFSVLSLRKL